MYSNGNSPTPRRSDNGANRASSSGGYRPGTSRIPPPPASPRTPAGQRPRRASDAPTGPDKRALPIGVVLMLLFVGLAFRLFYLQVIRHKELAEEARRMRVQTVFIPARRGALLDRNGTLLVLNQPTADVVVDPRVWSVNLNPKTGETIESRRLTVVNSLTAFLPGVPVATKIDDDEKRLDKLGRPRSFTLAEQIDPDLGEHIRDAHLIGVSVLPTAHRFAIDGQLAPHLLGFTGKDGAGLDGLEKRLNASLTGTRGEVDAEFDHHIAIPGTIQSEKPVENGRDVVLTLDSTLQQQVQHVLGAAFEKYKAEAATAVVLDPKTGDILACANYPAFDINTRMDPIDPKKAAAKDAWADRAVTSPYEPGSTAKIITVAAALEEKVVTPESHFFCNGEHQIGNKTIHCHLDNAFPHGHGDETLTDVIKNSCNVATAACAAKVGKQKLYEYEQAFGFGEKTGCGLPGESRGRLSPPQTWSDIQLANIAFGQGMSVTPLQLAAAYAAIANDGVYHRPHIVWGERNDQTQGLEPDPAEDGRRVVSVQTARELQSMLHEVVEHGTGRNAQLDGYSAGGKTGTAQIADHGSYANRKFVASFIGIAPMVNPQFVILVAVTNPQGAHFGAEVSAPVFKQIAEQALLDRRVPHDKSPVLKQTPSAPKGSLRDD